MSANGIKKNHHYVPRFWIKRFSNTAGQLYGKEGGKTGIVSAGNVMSEDYLYTVFNKDWVASDEIEDDLSVREGKAAKLFERICDPATTAYPSCDKVEICDFFGLQAVRHPDILTMSHMRSKEMGIFFEQVRDYGSADEFAKGALRFGIPREEAKAIYASLIQIGPDELLTQVDELLSLDQNDPRLPIQEALKADSILKDALLKMDITVLDAPYGSNFILGDTPLPQFNLSQGFIVPISKSVALEFQPDGAPNYPIVRKSISHQEVNIINQTQWELSKNIIVGPTATLLDQFS